MAIERTPATPVEGLIEQEPQTDDISIAIENPESVAIETDDGGMIIDFDPDSSPFGIEDFNSWINFRSKVEKHCYDLKKILTQFKNKGKKIIAYGASARSSTLLNYCQISTESVDLIIDQSDFKQGLFTAGTKIPIKSPEDGMQSNPDVSIEMYL